MRPRSRTLVGILLFIPLAGVILATLACLPAPVGDPASSKVNPALVGAYQGISTDPADKSKLLVILRPWDDHTYLLQYMNVDADGKGNLQIFKAWLTDLGGATFITCEPVEQLASIPSEKSDSPYWVVLRLDKTADGLKARMVDPNSPLLKGLEKTKDPKALSAAIEGVLKAHANDNALYSENPPNFKKLGEKDLNFINSVTSVFYLGPREPTEGVTLQTQPQPATKPGMP